jgi:hypothetical protein
MNRSGSRTAATLGMALLISVSATVALAPAAGAHSGGRGDRTITLSGDPVAEGGSKFEGIGIDPRRGTLYVSETTGGEISRGNVRGSSTTPWLDGDGSDGRWTARGITVDRAGRVYIAGGPNGIDHPGAPDLWVYSRGGRLLAALDTGVDGAFLNDVAIGRDGAAYFTNSNAPQIFRVAKDHDAGWAVTTWVDATGTIATAAGFNLGGIVAASDGEALIVAQGNVGAIWRFDFGTRAVTPISTGGADLTAADGLVLRGHTLLVIRNFARVLTTLKLSRDWTEADLIRETPTDSARVLTTGKLFGGRLYAVDSKFDEAIGTPPYQVVVLRIR